MSNKKKQPKSKNYLYITSMAFPNNMVRIRNGRVTPITVPEDKLRYLKNILDSKTCSSWTKEMTIKKIMGGMLLPSSNPFCTGVL